MSVFKENRPLAPSKYRRVWPLLGLILSGLIIEKQASVMQGLDFDLLPLVDDGMSSSEVGIYRGHIAKAFVIALVIVMVDKGLDLGFKIAG